MPAHALATNFLNIKITSEVWDSLSRKVFQTSKVSKKITLKLATARAQPRRSRSDYVMNL